MIKHNEYFAGAVQSLSLDDHDKPATIGVMSKGRYEFGTEAAELMKVIEGELIVKLPGSEDWVTYLSGTQFHVPANSKFQLQVPVSTAYLCVYG
ncbi:pyrimidine/purine nucleoside phosphorylase [Reinekea forsetii]|nr:pyrimidine/purine nucleoside phosphorylase [Reinekea forsetii]